MMMGGVGWGDDNGDMIVMVILKIVMIMVI